jgi:hypothetical protein
MVTKTAAVPRAQRGSSDAAGHQSDVPDPWDPQRWARALPAMVLHEDHPLSKRTSSATSYWTYAGGGAAAN